MSDNKSIPLSIGLAEADLYMANVAINKAESLSAFCRQNGHIEEVL